MARRKSKKPARLAAAVSDAELDALKPLWEKGPMTPSELMAELAGTGRSLAYTTVQTLLHRLLQKGHVARSREGKTQVYRAVVSREDLLARQMQEMAERLCDGASAPLMLSLVRGGKFSKAELRRFREILESESRR